jgi:hypothetical protein
MTVRRLASTILIAAMALLSGPAVALAQGAMRPETIRATNLDDAQKAEVAKYVADNQGGLSSDNPAEVKRSREDLLKPLGDKQISVSFRQEYSQRLEGALKKAVASPKENIVVTALRIAGELATPVGTDIIEPFRKDPRSAIRYWSAAAWGRAFDAMATRAPAIATGRALVAVRALAASVADEKDPRVLDALARALASAAGVEALRTEAYAALAQSFGQRMDKMPADRPDPAMLEAFIRATETIRNGVATRKIAANDPVVVGAAGKGPASVLTAGALSHIIRCTEAGDFPATEPGLRDLPYQLTTSSLAIIALTDSSRGAEAANKIVRDWRDGKASDTDFTGTLKKIIGK